VSGLVPKFVKDAETGEKCMQLCLGSLIATLPLPGEFGTWDDDRQRSFITEAVHQMSIGLHERRREDQRKLRRKTTHG
jgi:hypothetical protein